MLQLSTSPPVGRLATGVDVLKVLGEPLDDLYLRCGVPLTQRRLWHQTWLDIHPAAGVWAVSAGAAGRLDAVLVLRETSGPAGERVVRALCPRGDDRLVPAVVSHAAGHELARTLAGELLSRRGPWALSLGPVPLDDPFLRQLHSFLPQSHLARGAPIPQVHPCHKRGSCSRGADLLCLSNNMQRNLRKANNRLAIDGHLARTEVISDPHVIEQWLDRVWQLRCDRDSFVGRAHPDPRGALRTFWRSSLRAHADLGVVELSLLHVGGQLAAYVLALTEPSAYRVLEGRFDSAFARYNPGRLLEADVVRRAVCDEGRHLDWMNGVAAEKLVTATTFQQTEWLHASG